MAGRPKGSTKGTLTIKDREGLKKLFEGRLSPDRGAGKRLLSKPHVAVALEYILDEAGLTDERLTKRLRQIIRRDPLQKRDRTGRIVGTNAPALDSNARETIKMIWQAKGKFTEKHEIKKVGELSDLEDDELDRIINQGWNFLKNRGIKSG